ncbi:MAG: 2-haloacid dehalogenase [Chloroflexota bacterium]|jgi:2-haloalkanoic acid dehalogenase type II|nr:2-haloacid dehalogenase [Chloroflexota bacterium]
MAVRWCTFDCYGTLIDWEGGITAALLPYFDEPPDRDALAREYIETEATVESGAYLRYHEVLDRAGAALLRKHGIERPSPLPASLPGWIAFAEVPAALRALQAAGRRIAILSNVDRDLIATSIPKLGITPDLVVTAEDVGSYKPAAGHWTRFAEVTGATTADTVHVGASQYHDMQPAAALGYRTVFIDRHGESLTTTPNRILRDLSALPEAIAALE